MLGLVMAGDVLTLFIFWEATSIISFLLVAYKYKDETARRGAFKALFITGGGGIALLIGLLFVSQVCGSTSFTTILASGDLLRHSTLYPVILGLVALGGFTKSAQFPFHIWLPDAMSAPTPASAYLHSATMVKAGIYLMARLNPVLGQTEIWFWLLTLVGMATMLTGAYLGLKQNDLKALLAYSTISQLGLLMMMIGQDIEIAFKALIIGILAHALYKSALFMVAGIVDHQTGTRDLRRLGGLRRSMPYTFGVGAIAALSMAGLPPLFGFLAKETLLATTFHPSLPNMVAWIFTLASIVTGALMFTLAIMLLWDTFMGEPRDPAVCGHEAPKAMVLAPAIPAILSLILAQLPGPKVEAALLANAARAAHGFKVKVSLALWTGSIFPCSYPASPYVWEWCYFSTASACANYRCV
jgi:NADH:ubiquinone oxidoreductase subunit 5 (subunit L)/multisubunit Na+/H+ antiporter MnhA subunit